MAWLHTLSHSPKMVNTDHLLRVEMIEVEQSGAWRVYGFGPNNTSYWLYEGETFEGAFDWMNANFKEQDFR